MAISPRYVVFLHEQGNFSPSIYLNAINQHVVLVCIMPVEGTVLGYSYQVKSYLQYLQVGLPQMAETPRHSSKGGIVGDEALRTRLLAIRIMSYRLRASGSFIVARDAER